jgi:hypothetical protein
MFYKYHCTYGAAAKLFSNCLKGDVTMLFHRGQQSECMVGAHPNYGGDALRAKAITLLLCLVLLCCVLVSLGLGNLVGWASNSTNSI